MKKLAPVGGLIGLVSVLVGVLYNPSFTFTLTQQEVQSRIAQTLPLRIEKRFTEIVVDTADIQLEENDIVIDSHLIMNLAGVKATGNARVSSQLRYDNGNFYLANFNVIDYIFHTDDESKTRMIKRAADRLVDKVKSKVVDPNDTASAGAFDRVKGEQVEKLKALLIVKLEMMAEKTPIYSLNGKDIKQSVAAMAIKQVDFTPGNVTVTLTVATLLKNLLLYAGSLVLAIGLVLTLFLGARTR